MKLWLFSDDPIQGARKMEKAKKVMSSHAGAAKMIRAYMKANGIAGRVNSESYSMGSSVRVYVEDMPPEAIKALEAYAGQFEYGHFDGMQDLYEYSNVNNDIPQVKYVFVNNEISDVMRQAIWVYAMSYYAGMEGAPFDAKDAGMFRNVNFDMYGNQIIYKLFAGGYCNNEFWDIQDGAKQIAA